MIKFKRGVSSKQSLNLGILSNVTKIIFEVLERKNGKNLFIIGNRVYPINNFILRNGEFDKKKVFNKLKQLHGLYKRITQEKYKQNKINEIVSVSVEIRFGIDDPDIIDFDDNYSMKNNKVLDILYN